MKTRVGLIGMSALAFMWSDVAIAQAPPADPGATTEQAMKRARPGHDEYVKFLSPYGRFGQYADDLPFGYAPTLEETRAAKAMAIGSVDDVVDVLGEFRDKLDLQHVLLFPEFPGLTREEIDEQLVLLAEEVMPRLGVTLAAGAPAS